MKKHKFYFDTSVFGGVLDVAFEIEFKRLFKYVQEKRIQILLSQIIYDEIYIAPKRVIDFFESINKKHIEFIESNAQIFKLAEAYLSEKVVNKKSRNDALHVAHATCSRSDAIISWNFKDIVRFDRIKGFNRVNFENGYGIIQIISPKEVYFDE